MKKILLILYVSYVLSLTKINCSEMNKIESKSENIFSSIRKPEISSKYAACPDANVIFPCSCLIENGLSIMDCSDVANEEELRGVFTQTLGSNNFYILNVLNNYGLTSLTSGVFGNSTFEFINFNITSLAAIESDIFDNMKQFLRSIILENGQLTKFKYNFEKFEILQRISLNRNQISFIKIKSPTLLLLQIEYNEINKKLIANCPNLLYMYAAWNKFESIPLQLIQYRHLKMAHFGGNPLSNLKKRSLCHSDSLIWAYLGKTGLSNVGINKICLKDGAEVVSLRNNEITTLDREEFEPLLEKLNPNGLEIFKNPLVCGCDAAWIFRGNFTGKIEDSAKCQDGSFLTQKTEADFIDCP